VLSTVDLERNNGEERRQHTHEGQHAPDFVPQQCHLVLRDCCG
jgi:hypothetical protein